MSGVGTGPEREATLAERRSASPEASIELTRRIAQLVDAKGGEQIVALDVRELVSYTDFLIIATARNERQAKAIQDEVQLLLKREDELLASRVEGKAQSQWILLDYLDCVLHLFTAEMRDRYRLERLWGEAPQLELGIVRPEA